MLVVFFLRKVPALLVVSLCRLSCFFCVCHSSPSDFASTMGRGRLCLQLFFVGAMAWKDIGVCVSVFFSSVIYEVSRWLIVH